MVLKVIDIGNSKGIRLPQALIKNYGIADEIKVELNEEGILLKPIKGIRKGWEEQFKNAATPVSTEEEAWQEPNNKFDGEEWEW
jgi:antitoxin MazE